MIKLVKRIKQLFGDMLIPVGSQGGYTTVQDIVNLASSGGVSWTRATASYTDFQDASDTVIITVAVIPTNHILTGILVRETTAFAGTGFAAGDLALTGAIIAGSSTTSFLNLALPNASFPLNGSYSTAITKNDGFVITGTHNLSLQLQSYNGNLSNLTSGEFEILYRIEEITVE